MAHDAGDRAEGTIGPQDGLSDELEQVMVALEDARDEASALARERDALRAETDTLRDQLAAERSRLAQREASAEEVRRRFEASVAELTTYETDGAVRREELQVSLEELQVTTEALEESNIALARLNKGLQEAVAERTAELEMINAALREREAQLHTLMAGIPQLVWRSQKGGCWTWSSPQWQAFTGQSQARSREHGWLDAVHPDDRESTIKAWEAAQPHGLLNMEFRIRRASDGAWLWHYTRAAPVHDAAGRTVEWLGTSLDIEDQVRAREVLARGHEELEALVFARTAELMAAEETLRQSQKMEAVGQLTGGIAHDFNNMLQGVAGGLSMAQRRVSESRIGEANRYLEAARDAVGRAAGLTRRLLAFARRQRLEPKLVDADSLVAGLAELIRRTMGPAITVEIRLRDGTGSVLCDPNELESVLLNLCINARDAMPEGGCVSIDTTDTVLGASDTLGEDAEPGRYTAISVTDTGIGMPPEVLARVFEPFFTTKPQGQGTGLGLSQVWGFVRQSGGLVRIESALGRGTTVRILLPQHDRVVVATDPPPMPAPEEAGTHVTVLLVDDEDLVRRPVADRLRELGYIVVEARDGPEALRLQHGTRPDLLVTDVGLPHGMNGRQVAEAMRERQPGLPVLYITGYSGAVLPSGVEVIGKPFELDTLVRRVRAISDAGHPKNCDPEH